MQFNKTILDNGLTVVTVPMADNPSVTILIMVKAGSKYETKKINGISHFLEHMVFKGTTKRPKMSDISRELDSIGAHYNAFTGQEVTGYWVKADAKKLDIALDVVADMYIDPLLNEQEIEKEKGVIVEEIRMYNDLPQYQVHDIMNELLYGDQPAGWNIAGTEETVKSFKRQDIVDYRNSHYVSEKTIVIVSGSFDEKTIIQKIDKAFSSISSEKGKAKLPVKEAQSVPKMRSKFKETDQTHLVISTRTFPITDERLPAMTVLATVMGKGMSSRLFTKMRDEMGICYYIKTDHGPSTDHGELSISAGVDNNRVKEAITEILKVCARFKTDLVPESELKKAKDYISGTTMLELETSEARAEYAGSAEILKGKIETPKEILGKIQSVTAEDVRKLANQIFVDKHLNLALVGRSDADSFKSILKY